MQRIALILMMITLAGLTACGPTNETSGGKDGQNAGSPRRG